MKAKEVREKYIKFFKSSPRNHKEIEPAPLVLENDPTTLFTSSGMQPLVPYLMGEKHPKGKRLVDSQPSIRLQDIDEVGDNRHTTFFEMLGNWSLGDYFKDEQLPWVLEFFTRDLGLDKNRLWISVFEGDEQVPRDTESFEIWKKLGVPEKRIVYYPAKKNWWSMTGTPSEMNVGHIGGPDSEIFYDFGEDLKIHEKSRFKGEGCHPNCDCGRFLEIGNSVFIQYKKISDTKLEELPQKNVDFGGGLERVVAAVNNDPDIFEIDLFSEGLKVLEAINKSKLRYLTSPSPFRIILDHLRASVFLVNAGVTPSNKEHGYVLRRLIRKAMVASRELGMEGDEWLSNALPSLVVPYKEVYPGLLSNTPKLNEIITREVDQFRKTIDKGLKEFEKSFLLTESGQGLGLENEGGILLEESADKLDGKLAFKLFETYGFPIEISIEEAKKRNLKVSPKIWEEFKVEKEKHAHVSRSTSAGVFKGGLADHSPEVIKLHTATHLLLASLRNVLGTQVVQKGQNITKERTRFDFPNPEKLTDGELKKVEDMINEVIKKDLPVNFIVMPKEEALKTGAIHAFNEKYADTVKVYYVGDNLENAVSREFCGGPHVSKTSEIGRVRINRQEKVGSGVVRIYLVLG